MQPSGKTKSCICNDIDGTRGYYAKQNKSIRERQLPYDLSDMRNLTGRLGVVGGREGKNENKMGLGGRQTIRDSSSHKN